MPTEAELGKRLLRRGITCPAYQTSVYAPRMESSKKPRVVALVLFVLAVLVLALTAAPPDEGRAFFGLWRTRWVFVAGGLMGAGLTALAVAHSRVMLFRLVAMVFASGLAIGFLELIGIVGLVSYPKAFGLVRDEAGVGFAKAPKLDLKGQTFMDTASTWGMESPAIDFHFQTNELGYRNPPDRTEGDVYVLGDSIVVSPLTSFEDSVPAQLEKALGRPVLSLALCGISPDREQSILREASLPLRDKLVVQLIFEGNDLLDTAGEQKKTEGEAVAEAKLPLSKRTLTYAVLNIVQKLTQPVDATAAKRSCQVGEETYTFLWTERFFRPYLDAEETIRKQIQAFHAEVESAGGTLALVYVPAKIRVIGPLCTLPPDSELDPIDRHLNPFRQTFLEWGRTTGVPILDVTEPLQRSAKAGKSPWFWGDTHPNETGMKVIAGAIAEWELVRSWSNPPSQDDPDGGPAAE